MKNLDAIFGRIWPQIKLNSTHPLLQCCYNRLHTTLAVELISSEVRVMSRVYEVVCQWLCHILMNLQTTNNKQTNWSVFKLWKTTAAFHNPSQIWSCREAAAASLILLSCTRNFGTSRSHEIHWLRGKKKSIISLSSSCSISYHNKPAFEHNVCKIKQPHHESEFFMRQANTIPPKSVQKQFHLKSQFIML